MRYGKPEAFEASPALWIPWACRIMEIMLLTICYLEVIAK